MPVPAEVVGVLQALFGIDVEPDVGTRGFAGGVGEDDTGCEIPDGALTIGLYGLEVALDVGPVPVRLLLLVVLGGLLIHHKIIIIFSNVIRLHMHRAYINTTHRHAHWGNRKGFEKMGILATII